MAATNVGHVADRAGVSKATIYRWWSSKELLALDAFSTDWEAISPLSSPDIGSLRDDLRARLRPFRRLLRRRPVGRVLAGLVAQAQTDPEFAELYRLFQGHLPLDARFREEIIETVVTGLERGKFSGAARKPL